MNTKIFLWRIEVRLERMVENVSRFFKGVKNTWSVIRKGTFTHEETMLFNRFYTVFYHTVDNQDKVYVYGKVPFFLPKLFFPETGVLKTEITELECKKTMVSGRSIFGERYWGSRRVEEKVIRTVPKSEVTSLCLDRSLTMLIIFPESFIDKAFEDGDDTEGDWKIKISL